MLATLAFMTAEEGVAKMFCLLTSSKNENSSSFILSTTPIAHKYSVSVAVAFTTME